MSGTSRVPAGPVEGADPRAGTLVCVGGAPGAGKTTVGALVAAAGGLCLVDLDSVTTPLVEAFAASLGTVADLDAPRFAALRDGPLRLPRPRSSPTTCGPAAASSPSPRSRSEAADAVAWRERARAWGATRVVLCWLDVDPGEAAARAAARGLPRDLAKAGSRAGASGRRRHGIPGGRPAGSTWCSTGRRDAQDAAAARGRGGVTGHNAPMSEDAVDRAQRVLEEGISTDFSPGDVVRRLPRPRHPAVGAAPAQPSRRSTTSCSSSSSTRSPSCG